MDKSEQVDKLFEALSQAQGEFDGVGFDAVNPFLKNQYATLGAVIETAKPVLTKYGLSVAQLVKNDGDRVGVTTVLGHLSGQWISETVSLAMSDEKGKSAAQVAGSIITYLRRYALAAILGMYAEADDDGNAGGNDEKKKPAPPKSATPKPEQRKPTTEPESIRVITIWDGKTQRPPKDVISERAVTWIRDTFKEKAPFDNPAHLTNHLKLHFSVAKLADLDYEKATAFVKHLKGEDDDPKWYPPEPEKTVEVHDHEASSGYSDDYLNGIVAEWAKTDKRVKVSTYAELPNDLKADLMTLLTEHVGEGKTIVDPNDLKTIVGYLELG